MVSIQNIAVIASLLSTVIGILFALWRIAKSVTTTQLSVMQIQKDICEIKLIVDKTDTRVDVINEKVIGSERDIKAAHRRIDELLVNCHEERKLRLG